MAATRPPSPAYILAGPETGRRAAFTDELRASLKALDGAPPEEHRLYSQETDVGELLALLRNASLFAGRRLVEYRGAEAVKGKEQAGLLVSYLESPAQDAVLLLETDEFGLDKGIEAAVGAANKKTFFEMFENEKPRWVRDRLARDDLSIDAEGVDTLLELVENETGALDAACTGLAAGFPRGSSLGAGDVEAAVARTRREDAFSLFDRLAGGDLEASLSVLDSVLADRRGDAVQIIAALVWSFRRLGRILGDVESGAGFEEACLRQGVRGKTMQKRIREAASRYSPRDCARIVGAASDTDGALRSGLGSAFERHMLHMLVYSIVARKGAWSPTGPGAVEHSAQ